MAQNEQFKLWELAKEKVDILLGQRVFLPTVFLYPPAEQGHLKLFISRPLFSKATLIH
jgi:hypothetical protein